MIEIIRRGIYTSIQDAGRFNYQNIGVPISGPMDQQAFGIANQILNNAYNTAVLECSFMGPKIKFHKNTYISIAGAGAPHGAGAGIGAKPLSGDAIESIDGCFGFESSPGL